MDTFLKKFNGYPFSIIKNSLRLARFKVLMIGSTNIYGYSDDIVEMLQDPLKELLPPDCNPVGLEREMIIYSSGIALLPLSDETSFTWYPITSVCMCGAFKYVKSGKKQGSFVQLSEKTSASTYPTVFVLLQKNLDGTQVRCSAFIAKNDEAAFAAIKSCIFADQYTKQSRGISNVEKFRSNSYLITKMNILQKRVLSLRM